MRSTMALGRTFRSAGATWPRVPAGARRRPLSRTSVRTAPRPRRLTVLAPGPPSVTKPRKVLVTCCVPDVTVEPWRISVVLAVPARTDSPRVMISTGEELENSSRRRRDPVTTNSSVVACSVAASSGFGVGVVSWAPAGAESATPSAKGARIVARLSAFLNEIIVTLRNLGFFPAPLDGARWFRTLDSSCGRLRRGI